MTTTPIDLRQRIRSIHDFPKPGIVFRDITPLLADPQAFSEAIHRMADHFRNSGVDACVAAEARGFIFAAPLAIELGAAFVPVRKPGKLPFNTEAFHYELEYGSDSLEMHIDALAPGQRILIVDDLLATGGTVEACIRLAQKSQVDIVGCAFLIELDFLGARQRLEPHDVFSLIRYQTEHED